MSGHTPEHWGTEHQGEILATLREFVAIPSVSTDPAYAVDVRRGADFLAAHMRACGLENVAVRPTAGHPVVMADWLHAGARPTILIYGHYDVQPPEPLAKWRTPPFEPTLRDGRLYGRGASDDKGPVIVALSAIAAFLKTSGRLPINVKLLIEGEEEIGSANLDDFVTEHAAALAADFVLSADGATWRVDLPTIAVASRGICALEVKVIGAEKDLHSGRHGGSVANPLQVLSRLLASLHDETGAVTVGGFYDSVRLPSADERRALAEIPFDEAEYLRSVGAPEPARKPSGGHALHHVHGAHRHDGHRTHHSRIAGIGGQPDERQAGHQALWFGVVTFTFSIANFVGSPILGALVRRLRAAARFADRLLRADVELSGPRRLRARSAC